MTRLCKRRQRSLAVTGLLLLALLLAVPSAWAFERRGGETIVIGPDEVIEDDLYVGANTFILNGTVRGDVVAVGGSIEINGTIEGDLMAIGQVVLLNSVVRDDARIAGQTLILTTEAQVGDHVVAVGQSLEVQEGSSVDGALLFAGQQAMLAGDVGGDLEVSAGGLELAGSIGGDVKADVGGAEKGLPPTTFARFVPGAPPMPAVTGGLTVNDGASIGGNLEYTSPTEGQIAEEAEISGEISYVRRTTEEMTIAPAARTFDWFLGHLRRLITLLLVGLLMVQLAPATLSRATNLLETKPLISLGWGIVALPAFWIAVLVILLVIILLTAILDVATLDGLAVAVLSLGLLGEGLLILPFVLALVFVTNVIVSCLVGRLLLRRVKPGLATTHIWPLVIGLVLYVILRAIPYLGTLVLWVVLFLGLGALWLLGQEWLRNRRTA